jgi:uncharacterized delta-60 repeat protein
MAFPPPSPPFRGIADGNAMNKKTIVALLLFASTKAAAGPLDPDTSFNNNSNGRLQVYFDIGGGKAEEFRDSAISSTTGAIYSVGSVDVAPGRRSALLVKRLANGQPDNAFSLNKSWMRFDTQDGTSSSEYTAVDYGGGAVYVGGHTVFNGKNCAIVRKIFDNPVVHGAIDTTYNGYGRFILCPGEGGLSSVDDLKVQPDGKVVFLHNQDFYGEKISWLWRLNADGTMDETFSAPGRVMHTIDVRPGHDEVAQRIVITGNSYLVAGSSQYAGDDWDGYVIRVLADGTRDTSYGSGGVHWEALDDANTPKEDRVADLAVDSSGRAVLLMNSNKQYVRAIRLTTSGGRDTTFNGSGISNASLADTTGSSGSYSYTRGAALAINSAQQIWVVGSLVMVTANGSVPDTAALAVTRLGPSGTQQIVNGVLDYGQDEYGVTAHVVAQDRLLVGTRLRTTTIPTDYDFGYLRVLGTP